MSHHYRSCSERQPQAQEQFIQSNPIIRVHPDSQQSLDRLFNPVNQTAVPLRDRQLPKSFFNPGFKATNDSTANDNNNNTGITNGNHHGGGGPTQSVHCRSMSFDQRPTGRVQHSFHMRTASTLAPMPALASSNHSSHQSSSNEFNSFTNNSTTSHSGNGWSSTGNSMEDLMATKCEISNGQPSSVGVNQQMIQDQPQNSHFAPINNLPTQVPPTMQQQQQQQQQQQSQQQMNHLHHHHHNHPPPPLPPHNHHHHHQHMNNNNNHHHHHHNPNTHHQHQYAPVHQHPIQSPLEHQHQQQPAPIIQQQLPRQHPHQDQLSMHTQQQAMPHHQLQQQPQNHLARPAFYGGHGATSNDQPLCTNLIAPVTNNNNNHNSNLHNRSMSFDQRQAPRTMNQNLHMRTNSVVAPMSATSTTNHSSHQSSHEFLNYSNQTTMQNSNEWSSSGYSINDMTAATTPAVAVATGTPTTASPAVASASTNWVPGQSHQVHAQPVQYHHITHSHTPHNQHHHQMMVQQQHHHQPLQPPNHQPPQQVFYT